MSNFINSSKIFLKKHSSTILTVTAAIGVIATSVATAKATLKATEILKEEEKKREKELTNFEKIKIAAPKYIFPVAIGASTIACIFGANILNKRQQAALISAYGLLDNSYKRYKDKVKELYGEEVHNNVIDAIAKEDVKDVHINAPGVISTYHQELDETDMGETRLFYDEFSGRYFETTLEKVLLAEYHLNRNFILRGCAPLNEFYDFLGLEPKDYGDVLGWTVYEEIFWIDFNHRKAIIGDDLECYIIEMPYCPRRNLRRRRTINREDRMPYYERRRRYYEKLES